MNYLDTLQNSSQLVGNCACIGLDPVPEKMPSGLSLEQFFESFLTCLKQKSLIPAAFKPNIAYFAAVNKPLADDFSGYKALAFIIKCIRHLFPQVPIILDAKRGDIATSSEKYASEAFSAWTADAVTVSGYMGHDSVLPFCSMFEGRGVYVLNRTSNAGATDVQNLKVLSPISDDSSGFQYLYEELAHQIIQYAKKYSGIGAVVGATGLEELATISRLYSNLHPVPLLIPGAGAQGGSAQEVIEVLRKSDYPLYLVRINSSSGLTSPWKKAGAAPENWLDACMDAVKTFIAETSV